MTQEAWAPCLARLSQCTASSRSKPRTAQNQPAPLIFQEGQSKGGKETAQRQKKTPRPRFQPPTTPVEASSAPAAGLEDNAGTPDVSRLCQISPK